MIDDDLLSITLSSEPDAVVCIASGEVDPSTSGALAAGLREALVSRNGREVVLDLSGVTFIDSCGVGVILDADRAAQADGHRLILRSPGSDVTSVLDMTNLTARLHIED